MRELWRQMFCPLGQSDEALARLRFELSSVPQVRDALEGYLYAQWLECQHRARVELNPEMKRVHQASAETLADVAGRIFQPEFSGRATNGQVSL